MAAPPLSEFIANIHKHNIHRPTLYYVEIILPKIFWESTFLDSKTVRMVSMFCHDAHTPQTNISTDDDHIENGTRRKFAYDQDYQNLNLSFYLDQKFQVKKFFDQWKQAIVHQRRNFNYPEEYTSEAINVYIIDQSGKPTYKYEYTNIYPKSFNSVNLSYSSTNTVSSFSVDFVFEDIYYTSYHDNSTSRPNIPVMTTRVPGAGITNKEISYDAPLDDNNGLSDVISGRVG